MRRAFLVLTVFISLIFFTGDREGVSATGRLDNSARSWLITLEEPTGIFRRDQEVVTIPLEFRRGEARAGELAIISPGGAHIEPQVVVASQHADGSLQRVELLFPATIIPGERPVYRLVSGAGRQSAPGRSTSNLEAKLEARRIGVGRFEIATELYAVIINLGMEKTTPGIVAAWHRRTADGKMLNLVDTSPDVVEPLDLGVKNGGIGTFLASGRQQGERSGHFERVEILEPGPWRLRVRMCG